jgi:CO/xanthine dehydrogenase Mo-binding subunit
MNADGSVIAYVGTTELGQGSRNTMAKIVSRELRVPLAQVTVVSGNTKVVPFDMLTASSRSTVTMGRALSDAAEKLKSRVRQISAEHLRREAEEVEIADGGVRTGDEHHSYAEVLAWEYGPGIGELEFQGAFVGEKDPEHPIGGPTPFYEIVMTAAEAEVDEETGELQVRRLITLSDVGKLINPLRAEGVDEGGVVMGLGASAMEHLVYGRNGRIENPSSLDYRIPTVYDVPDEMHTQFQENEDGPGPFGSKGLGEGGILGIAPALAEAIYQSAGVRMRSLPFTSEAIWKALQEKEGNDRQRNE